MIGLHEVSFSYPGSSALLKQLSFEFDRGFFYGIYGANGCGKSTLLKLITGELIPDSGRVNVPWQNEKQRSLSRHGPGPRGRRRFDAADAPEEEGRQKRRRPRDRRYGGFGVQKHELVKFFVKAKKGLAKRSELC